ncbi:MAG: hypothetical protein SNJ33_05015 [Rikenellaceae bacterium]
MSTMLMGCASNGSAPVESTPEYENIQTARFTVGEGKRLIAKGIAANKEVAARLEKGMVIITRGTTNTYIAEELVGLSADAGSFVTGSIFPTGAAGFTTEQSVGEIVIVDGEVVDMSYDDALAQMSAGDIVFKGGNILNYAKGQAAVNMGAPTGGTVAKLRKYTDIGEGKWIIPIGLEKDCSLDIEHLSQILSQNNSSREGTVLLNVGKEGIYTEIEALKEFADVDIYPIALGGVGGAEGGVSLMICGSKGEVDKAMEVAKSVHGEAKFF